MTVQATALTWSKSNLTSLAGAPPSFQPRPYVRSDGTTVVVSYSTDTNKRIFELARVGNGWVHHDLLSHADGNPVPGHTPYGFVRADGYSSVVYLSSVGLGVMEIHELGLDGNGWHHANLTAVTGATLSAGGTLQGFTRADGFTSLVYKGDDDRIHELGLDHRTGQWLHADLFAAAGAPTGRDQRPSGDFQALARPDGVTVIVYTSVDGHVRQLRLGTNGRWKAQRLTEGNNPKAAGYGVTAYTRSDQLVAIVYRGRDGHIYEMGKAANGEFDLVVDLSAITGAAKATGWVYGYVRADRTSTIIYEGPDFHIHELALGADFQWTHSDLTAITNSKPGFQPVGYIRSDGATAIVYYDVDEQIRQLKLS